MTVWLRMGIDGCLGCLPWPWPSKPHYDALEAKVEEVWRRVLALPPGGVRPEDSFLELGGESLLALRVCATLRYELGGEAEPDEDVAPGDEKAPQFGHVSGAFAVATLLAAPSFRAFCDGLRRGGYSLPGDGVPCQGREQQRQAWPRLRSAARKRGPGAAAALAAELDAATPEDAQQWIGAAARQGNAKAAGSFTALHAAAQANATECVQFLLERRARATTTEPGAAMTPLHYAAMASGAGALDLLLKAKAPLTVRDARGQSLLHAAARSGSAEALRRLLQAMKDSRSRGFLEWSDRWARSAVHWASLNGHSEVLKILLEAKA
ncbi:INVS [Symbiodinium sp. CCMP2592]|nr:INVS [Symbiodinium sp. CCMP2592]